MLSLINNIQAKLIELDMKMDTLIFRNSSDTRTTPKLAINSVSQSPRPNDQNRARTMHTAICADCKKECTIPFKPSGDRPVYCKDCFSRRKMMNMAGMKVEDKPQEVVLPKAKKKAAAVKKTVAKKKPTPKKK